MIYNNELLVKELGDLTQYTSIGYKTRMLSRYLEGNS